MFSRSGQSTLTPEVPRRKHRKGLSSSGHNLNSLGQQKYDRDALAFNHYIGFLKQPLRRHLSSDITYLVPSMPVQLNTETSTNQPFQLVNRDVNQLPPPLPPTPITRPTLTVKTPEPIYSAPRRQRSFCKQRSLDNENQSSTINSSNLGPNERSIVNPMGYLSVASSVPHLPQQSSSPQQSVQLKSGQQLRPVSVSTEGLIQHIISQQSQIERLSKQQDFLTQQLLISRDLASSEVASSRRSGRSRARSRSISSKTQHGSDSLSSLEPVKQRSSSREKIQEQLHAQQARVQQHIQQLEAQLELIRDIRTSSSTRPTSRSHSRATSVRDGSSCPPEEDEIDQQQQLKHSKRPLSADPKWFKSIGSPSSQLEDESKQLKSPPKSSVLPTIKPPSNKDKETINSPDQQLATKPRLMLTNPSEESRDDETLNSELRTNQNTTSKLVVNRPTLIDQDDGIPFMDDELIDEAPDGNESDELETVFEFDQSERSEKKPDYEDDEEEDYEDWEDEDELDYYSRDTRSPQAETDQWSRLMEEDILRAREEMDRQRSLMERQEMDLSNQRSRLVADPNEMTNLPLGQSAYLVNQSSTSKSENRTLSRDDDNQTKYSPVINQQNSRNLIPSGQLRSRSSNPFDVNQQVKSIPGDVNRRADLGQPNVFSFTDMDGQQSQSTSRHRINQNLLLNQPISSVNHVNQKHTINLINQDNRLSPNLMINQQQIASSSSSSFSPVINSRLRGTEGQVGIVPPRIIDRQVSTPIGTDNQIKSPNTNYIKRPSIEDQPADIYMQSSMLRSKMIPSPMNLASSSQFNQPSVPPRRKPVTPRTQSPVQLMPSATAPSYRIQTNKNRMAGQQIISSPRRPQRSQVDLQSPPIISQSNQRQQQQLNQQQYNQPFIPMQGPSIQPQATANQLLRQSAPQQYSQTFTPPTIGAVNLTGLATPRAYSPLPTAFAPPTINRPETMFRPIASNQQKTLSPTAPIIKIDPARSSSNLNLSSPSPSFNQSRRSPSPQPQQSSSSSASSFLKRAGSFIQRNTSNLIHKNQSKNQTQDQKNGQQQQGPLQQLRRSPSPLLVNSGPSITISPQSSPIANLNLMNPNGNTLKVDLQSIRTNRSSRASSPVPPPKDPPPPTRKIFINKDTVEAGSFVDHFNHYYAPQPEPNRRPLSQQFTNLSTGEINKIGRSITPMRDLGNQGKLFDENQPLKRSPSNQSNKSTNQSTANALIDAPMSYDRRKTLPGLIKGVEDKPTEEAVLRNLAGKKKHSLPRDDLHEVPLIPGWEREKVATMAHEAREARMNQPSGPVVHLTAATNWLIRYKLIGLIIFFNALLMYLFMRILRPINSFSEANGQSKPT